MTNLPLKIYIQIGDEVNIKDDVDFNELAGITWSSTRIHKTDIEYVLKSKRLKKRLVKDGKEVHNK